MRSSTHDPHVVDLHVGQRVRLARREVNLSQVGLAKLCGVTFQQIQKYERGANRISSSMLWKIAKALQRSLSYFYEGLPQEPVLEPVIERDRRGFAQSPRGVALLEAAMHLPPGVVAAHVEALQAVGAAISVASVGPQRDPVQ